MYHPKLLGVYHKNDFTRTTAEVWRCAIQGNQKVRISYDTFDQAKSSIEEMGHLSLRKCRIRRVPHIIDHAIYIAKGTLDLNRVNSFMVQECIQALGRRLMRAPPDTREGRMYMMMDELHVEIQLAVNDGRNYVCLRNPAPDRTIDLELAGMFKKALTAIDPDVLCVIYEGCYGDNGILVWNWGGMHPELKAGEVNLWVKDCKDINV